MYQLVKDIMIKLPKMSKQEIENILCNQFLCRIAFKESDYPYIAPFQYVYMNSNLYFHFTDYGRKIEMLKKDNRVCVEIEKLSPNLREYYFVSIRGRLILVENSEERNAVIRRMAEDGTQKLSPNFLAAHGLKNDEGWSSFTPEKPLVILKLDAVEEMGFKSL
jgi:nitroimidazol reductase NimA-like FMN-containing flavoprotein (pyridoxamine 5'-phosphate oxidase superfamily)